MGTDIAVPRRHRRSWATRPIRRFSLATTGLHAWWSQARLDRELAAGADPAADLCRAARAGQLTSMRTRGRIAHSIECMIEEAEGPWLGMSSEAPAQKLLVRDAAPALHKLADALAEAHAVEPRGVALSLLLLTDTSGPLYRADDSRALEGAAGKAVAALNHSRSP